MLSLHSNRHLLGDYLPLDLKVYEYNPCNDKKITTSLSEAADWLFAVENKSFVFQCLICYQEMEFRTVFWTYQAKYNRSHLLTKKHKRGIEGLEIVGLVFNCGKKFILCTEERFQSGKLFESIKNVKRKIDKILKNPSILNQAFGRDYKFYTFDRQNCKLIEFVYEDDFVRFMQVEVKPLFKFHCMLCDKVGKSYTQVVKHLMSIQHKREMGTSKVALLSVRDFNVFLACSFDKLTSFTYLEHPNSKLKEIIIGSSGCVLISGLCSNENKSENLNTLTETKLKSIMLPDNSVIINESIQVRIPFQTDQQDSKDSLIKSHVNYQNNVTIYEFSDNIMRDHQADNLIYSLLSSGCRMWCSRCSTGIYTLDEFEDHLRSQSHKARVRNNEQVGFMCYTCKVFFIELKGESLSHIHKGFENKNIMRVLDSVKGMIEYNLPLNSFINKAYSLKLVNFSDACFFTCLACFDLTKKKLAYLPDHESKKEHSNYYVFVLCEYCNVVYIDQGDKINPPCFIKEHFETHLYPGESRTVDLWEINLTTKEMYPFNMIVDSKPHKISFDYSVPDSTKISVSFSRFFCQLTHPGISQKEFCPAEKWTETSFSEYVSLFFTICKLSIIYKCLRCKEFTASTSTNASDHCFKKCPKNNSLSITYIKFCNICNELLMAANLDDIQSHFLSANHILVMLKSAGISNADVNIKEDTMTKCKAIFPTQKELLKIVDQKIEESKVIWENKNKTISTIRKDSLKLLNTCYPNAVVDFYGSQMFGLAVKDSDIDICFSVGEDDFDKVKSIFRNAKDVFELHLSLPDAHKPIFRLTHRETGKNCDVCLSLNWEIHFSKLVKLLIDYDERVHWLLIAVRYWSKMAKLRVPQVISSNGIIWLVLFFLMQPDIKIIPHISYIFEAWGGPANIINKDLHLDWDNSSAGREKSKLELLEGFFHFYSLLDFSKYAISPLTGCLLPRTPADASPWYLEDPFNSENIFARSTSNACQKFQALSYITLNMQWRIVMS